MVCVGCYVLCKNVVLDLECVFEILFVMFGKVYKVGDFEVIVYFYLVGLWWFFEVDMVV